MHLEGADAAAVAAAAGRGCSTPRPGTMMMNESKARAMPALCLSALHCEGIWEMICTAVVTVLMCALFPKSQSVHASPKGLSCLRPVSPLFKDSPAANSLQETWKKESHASKRTRALRGLRCRRTARPPLTAPQRRDYPGSPRSCAWNVRLLPQLSVVDSASLSCLQVPLAAGQTARSCCPEPPASSTLVLAEDNLPGRR